MLGLYWDSEKENGNYSLACLNLLDGLGQSMSVLLRLQDKAATAGSTIFDEKPTERRSPQQKAKCTVQAQADMAASETQPGLFL